MNGIYPKKVNVADIEYDNVRGVYGGYMHILYVAVAAKRIENIPKGRHIQGLWAYTREDLKISISDWCYNNSVPLSSVRIVKAYALSGSPRL